MNKKKLTRLIAVCTACLSMGIFAFSGCAKKGDDNASTGDDTEIGTTGGNKEDDKTPSGSQGGEDDKTQTGGEGGDDDKTQTGGDGGDDDKTQTGGDGGDDDKTQTGGDGGDDDTTQTGGQGKDPTKPGDPIVKPAKPEITGPVQGGPTITEYSEAELEAAYVEWTAADNAKWYNVYYSPKGANNWTKLDGPLVREYKDYFRADAIGLKAGEYDMKVVPVSAENTEATDYATTAVGITVVAHDRSGYAFVKGTSSGAYNEDGTLIAGANVIYVTDANKDTVELNGVKGVQNILQAQKKATVPLSVRFIGSVSSPAIPDKSFNKVENSLQAKENAKGLTLEGVGNDATVNGWTLRLINTVNVEVRNLGCMNTKSSEPDGISIEKGNHIWVHNCDIFYGGAGGDSDQAKGDGALDTKLESYVTHSYNHFYDTGKSNLQGMKDETVENYITYHHNWYDHSDSRHPRIRTCTVHIYNNYFDGNAKYGVGVTTGASAFVEKNYFRSTTNMKPMMSSKQGTDLMFADKGDPDNGVFAKEDGGMIKAFGNIYDCPEGKLKLITQNDTNELDNIDCFEAETRSQTVPSAYHTKYGNTTYSNFDTANDFYEYKVDEPEVAREKVVKYAGRMQGGDFDWEFDNEEDGNYSLIKGLKDALVAYKNDLVSVDGVAVTGGTTGGNTGTGEGEGGDEGTTNPPATIESKVVYNPNDGANGTYGIFTVTGGYKSGSTAVEIEGVTIASGKAVKFNSGGSVSFTVDRKVTLTVYINLNGIKINEGSKITGTQSADGKYYTITTELEAGTYTVRQGAGESQLYLLTLVPV